jgi:hypothetical protein
MKRDQETLSQLQMMFRVMTKIPELGELWSIPNVLNTAVGNSCHIVRFFHSKYSDNTLQCGDFAGYYIWASFPPIKACQQCLLKEPVLIISPISYLYEKVVPPNVGVSNVKCLRMYLATCPNFKATTEYDAANVPLWGQSALGPRDSAKAFRFGRFVRPLSLLSRILLEDFRSWKKGSWKSPGPYWGFEKVQYTLGMIRR